MKKITLYVDPTGHKSHKIRIDDEGLVPLDAFFITTRAAGQNSGHFICQGTTETVGLMLYNFYLYCLREEGASEMADMLEAVAEDILDVIKKKKDLTEETIRSMTH